MAAYLRSTSQLTIDRDDPRAAQATLDAALELLRGGQLLGCYPEGTPATVRPGPDTEPAAG